jgi:hypothetical protein
VKLTTHLRLVPRSKNGWSCTSTPTYAFMAWCLVRGSTGTTLPLPLLKMKSQILLGRGRWMTEVRFQVEGRLFLFVTVSKLALWPNQFLSNEYRGLLLRRHSGRGVKLTTNHHLMPRLRTRGAVPPLPHKSSLRDAQLSKGYIFMV